MSEEINIPEKSQTLKTDIEDCYRSAVKYTQLYKTALRRHIGNQNIYWIDFVGAFESLYIFTSVDPGIQKIVVMNNTFISVDPAMQEEALKDGSVGFLTDYVSEWLESNNSNHKRGEMLFLAYRKALFDQNILSLTG